MMPISQSDLMPISSEYAVGWMLAPRESAELATRLIAATCKKQKIQPGQTGLHADGGSAIRSKPVAFLPADLGVTKTHSRPYTSKDNPYSESQFKTMKYRPEFPDRFGCHSGRPGILPQVFPLVQRRASALWDRHDDTADGALWDR